MVDSVWATCSDGYLWRPLHVSSVLRRRPNQGVLLRTDGPMVPDALIAFVALRSDINPRVNQLTVS